jgi:hypothetical protein
MAYTSRITRQPRVTDGYGGYTASGTSATTSAITLPGAGPNRLVVVFVAAITSTASNADVADITSNGSNPMALDDFVKIGDTQVADNGDGNFTVGSLYVQRSGLKLADGDQITATVAGTCAHLIVYAVPVHQACLDAATFAGGGSKRDASESSTFTNLAYGPQYRRSGLILSFGACGGVSSLLHGSGLDTALQEVTATAPNDLRVKAAHPAETTNLLAATEQLQWTRGSSSQGAVIGLAVEIPFYGPFVHSYTTAAVTTTNATVAVPEDPETGDKLVAVVGDFTATPPAGWTTRAGDAAATPGTYNASIFDTDYASQVDVTFPSSETNTGDAASPSMGVVLAVVGCVKPFEFKRTGPGVSGTGAQQIPQMAARSGDLTLLAVYQATSSDQQIDPESPFSESPGGGVSVVTDTTTGFVGLVAGTSANDSANFPATGVELNETQGGTISVVSAQYGLVVEVETSAHYYLSHW